MDTTACRGAGDFLLQITFLERGLGKQLQVRRSEGFVEGSDETSKSAGTLKMGSEV